MCLVIDVSYSNYIHLAVMFGAWQYWRQSSNHSDVLHFTLALLSLLFKRLNKHMMQIFFFAKVRHVANHSFLMTTDRFEYSFSVWTILNDFQIAIMSSHLKRFQTGILKSNMPHHLSSVADTAFSCSHPNQNNNRFFSSNN